MPTAAYPLDGWPYMARPFEPENQKSSVGPQMLLSGVAWSADMELILVKSTSKDVSVTISSHLIVAVTQ